MNKDLELYIKEQLEKEPPEWFDHNGNSPRAVMMRGLRGEIKLHLKTTIPCLISDIKYHWNGIDTPIGYFLQLAVLPFILPFLPFLRAFYSYKEAKNFYDKEMKSKSQY